MATFTIYSDVSGHPDGTDVLSVAGFIANDGQWKRFEKEWKKVLADFGVSSLHMKNFAHSTGEFQPWKGDDRKRRSFLIALIRVIKRRVRHSFAVSIYLPHYREIDAVSHIREIRSPLAIAGCTLIQHVRNWSLAKGIQFDNIRFVFEDGDADKKNFAQASVHDCGVEATFMTKDQTVAFQAADLLAYEHLKANIKIVPSPGIYELEDLRQPLQALNEIPNGKDGEDWATQGKPELEATLKELFPRLGRAWP